MPLSALDAIRPLYAFLDPHGGKRGAQAERLRRVTAQSAIVVGGRDDRNIYVLDAWAERCSTDELIEQMFAMHERWQVKQFGGEENGLANLFLDAVLRESKWRGRPLPLVGIAQPSNLDKDNRVRSSLQHLIGHGRLFLREPFTPYMQRLVEQIEAFPNTPQKDLVDALASLARLMPARAPRIERDAERERKLRYLRDRGVDPRAIARIAAGGAP
jgi:predicted phage terminase large subunit-like protein